MNKSIDDGTVNSCRVQQKGTGLDRTSLRKE